MTASPRVMISTVDVDAIIFDLDGVVTRTATVHAAAWKQMFDEFLRERSEREGTPFRPFDADDYRRYIDGKSRYDGVRSFLESRSISLPFGEPGDPPERETVCGLGNRKNLRFLDQLTNQGVEVYESTVALLRDARARGLKTAIVSASKNCGDILEAAHLSDLFDARVDGVTADELGLPGKPHPATFLEAARRLGVAPERSVVVEDAIAGVQAGHDGGFGLVIGVNRSGEAGVLLENGADVEVADLSEVGIDDEPLPAASLDTLPSALDRLEEIRRRLARKRPAVFLDYDGTLTPIVEDPAQALLSEEMRAVIEALAARHTVAIISGRDLDNVRQLVRIPSVVYAGSHGFDIAGPRGWRTEYEGGKAFLPVLDQAEDELRARLSIEGAWVERKKFAIAVHYRRAREADVGAIEAVVDGVLSEHPKLRKSAGKKVFELRPRVAWDKGKAVLWLLNELGLNDGDVLPIYIGDDVTDEDAFRALRKRGIGIGIRDGQRPTAAEFALNGPDEVRRFLELLTLERG